LLLYRIVVLCCTKKDDKSDRIKWIGEREEDEDEEGVESI